MYYYNNNWQVVTEADSAGDTARYFVYGNFIDEPVLMVDVSGASAQRYYYIQDHLYSTAALVNNAGTVVERYEYDAYGSCSVLDADFSADADGVSDVDNPYGFTGRRLDTFDNSGLKLQYNRNRYYSSEMGRWLTKDPLGYKDGMNMYAYVHNNPMMNTDAYGLLSITPGGGGAGSGSSSESCGFSIYCSEIEGDDIISRGLRATGAKHCNIGKKYPEDRNEIVTYNVKVDRSCDRKMLNGPGKGKRCKCVSCWEIWRCQHAIDMHIMTNYRVIGNNCHTITARSLNNCCLSSDWKPEWHGGDDPLCIKWGTRVISYDGMGMPILGKVCVERLPDYN